MVTMVAVFVTVTLDLEQHIFVEFHLEFIQNMTTDTASKDGL